MNVLKKLMLAVTLLLPGATYAVESVNQDMIRLAAAIQLYKKECPGSLPEEMLARYELVAKVAGPDAVSAALKQIDAERMVAGNASFCALIKARLGLK